MMFRARATGGMADGTAWEAVVIGAGPAGALAARQLARRGVDVLLVERQTFPRHKVCGGCLNQRALGILQSVGLGDQVDRLGGPTIGQLEIVGFGRRLEVKLPAERAVSRAAFDALLVEEAIAAGATFLPRTNALVQPRKPGHDDDASRSVLLHAHGGQPTTVTASMVVAADGLGHPSLRRLHTFHYRIRAAARIGVGTTLRWSSSGNPGADRAIPPHGTVRMVLGRRGYVGMVRVGEDMLNIAAALDRQWIKQHSGSAASVAALLDEASVAWPDGWTPRVWKATPPLTCGVARPVAHRLVAIGDAAGYVEPFTGEGMAWALWAGDAVASLLCEQRGPWSMELERKWLAVYDREVLRRQKWCRRLAALLRFPTATRLAMRCASRVPSLTQSIVAERNVSAVPRSSLSASHPR